MRFLTFFILGVNVYYIYASKHQILGDHKSSDSRTTAIYRKWICSACLWWL